MAQLKHHMYHLNRISIFVINHLNDAIARIPFYADCERSMPELLKETKALIEKYENAPANERMERFVEQVNADLAESHLQPYQADSLLDPAMRLLEQLRDQLERMGDEPP